MAPGPSGVRRGGFEASRTNNCWNRRESRWPSQWLRCERPKRQPRSRDRTDGTSAGETHVSRVVEDPSESVDSEGYSEPHGPTKGAGAHAGSRTRIPPARCGTRQGRAGTADTNTKFHEVAVIDPGGQPADVTSDRACARRNCTRNYDETIDDRQEPLQENL